MAPNLHQGMSVPKATPPRLPLRYKPLKACDRSNIKFIVSNHGLRRIHPQCRPISRCMLFKNGFYQTDCNQALKNELKTKLFEIMKNIVKEVHSERMFEKKYDYFEAIASVAATKILKDKTKEYAFKINADKTGFQLKTSKAIVNLNSHHVKEVTTTGLRKAFNSFAEFVIHYIPYPKNKYGLIAYKRVPFKEPKEEEKQFETYPKYTYQKFN